MIGGDFPGPSARASFRDPSGWLCLIGGRVIRVITPSGVPDFRAFLDAEPSLALSANGRVIGSRILDQAAIEFLKSDRTFGALLDRSATGAIVEHEPIEFPSYPHEWPPEMLTAAGELTLDLAFALLSHDLGLKDATPYNILFQGACPVFVDVLSFERRTPGDATWLPYAQFVRTFLLPLLMNRRTGLGLDQVFIGRRDGLEPADVVRFLGPIARWLPPMVTLVTLPARLSAKAERAGGLYRKRILKDADRARFVMESVLGQLRRTLRRLQPESRRSTWSEYTEEQTHYSEENRRLKAQFVQAGLARCRPARVLDIGCNTGDFSEMAARSGANVVAIDSDPVVVGRLWRRARAANLKVLPLVVNLGRPTPAVGWRNLECGSFLARATGAFDMVLMLAVFHHLLVAERIPLDEILALAATLTRSDLLIEYVDPADPMFRRLSRGRDELFRACTRDAFEAACREHFEVVQVEQLPASDRWLYHLHATRTADA